MKTKKLFAGLFTVLMVFALSGCEQDANTLLTDGVWTFENMTTDSEDETIQSIVAFGKAFMTDATLEFSGDGTYILSSPLSDQPSTGTWSLIGSDQLTMDPDGDEPFSTGNIETLTKDKLTYIETFMDEQQQSYTTTTTWVR